MKRTLALILAVVMMMALVACGGDKPTSTPNNPTTSTPLQQGTGDINKDKDTPVTTDPAVKYKEHVEIACTGLPTTLDPYQKTNNVHDTTFKLSHNQLIYYNYETAAFEPELAAEWKTETADTYWFKLKQGVKFHNGEELTSDDVLWTWVERPKTMDAMGAATLVKMIKDVEIINDYEFRVKLKTPSTDFIPTANLSYGAILNREACVADPANGFTIGTGGWKLTEYVPNDHVNFEKFADAWCWTVKETPTKTLTLRQRGEATAAAVAVQTGECAATMGTNVAEYNSLKNDPSVKTAAFAAETLEYFYFNMKNGIAADDINLRKAIAYAVSYDDQNLVRFDGLATRHWNIHGPKQPGYAEIPAELKPEYNLDKAKEYLAKSKQPNGCTMTLTTSATFEQQATIMMEDLRKIGITVNVEVLDGTGFNAKMAEATGYDMGIYNISLNPNGARFKFVADPSSSTNRAHYVNDEMLAQFNAALAEPDEAKRNEIYKQIQIKLAEDMPYVPFFTGVGYTLENAKAGGTIWGADTKHDFTYIWQQAD